MVRFTAQFLVLDKSTLIPIRLGGQTPWEAVRNDFIENREKIAPKDYELHGRCAVHLGTWKTSSRFPEQ